MPHTPVPGETGAITASLSDGEWICQINPSSTNSNLSTVFSTKGTKSIKITAEDGVGLRNDTEYEHFDYDTTDPTITLTSNWYQLTKVSPVENSSSVTYTFTEETAQTGNNISIPSIVGKLIKLKGDVGDDYGLQKVIIVQKKTGGDTVLKEITVSGTSANWESPRLPLKKTGSAQTPGENDVINETYYEASDYLPGEIRNNSADGTYKYTIYVKDSVGKITKCEDTKTITLHTSAPTVTITSPAEGSWQQTNTVAISGTATTAYTLNGVYYKFSDTQPAIPSNPSNSTSWTGWDSAPAVNSWSKNITRNDSATAYKLWVAAVDNAGNVGISSSARSFKVDASEPQSLEDTKFYTLNSSTSVSQVPESINVKSDTTVTIYGNYKDEQSGVRALTFKLGTSTVNPTVTYYSQPITDAASISTVAVASNSTNIETDIRSWKAVFTFTSSGRLTVQGENRSNDSDGNGIKTTSNTILDVKVDNTAPTVTISTPSANAKVGATALTISGTASDGTGAGLSNDNMILYYTKSSSLGTATTAPASTAFGTNAASQWVQLDNTITAGETWSVTKTLADTVTPNNANTDVYFMASAKDNAGDGNTGYSAPRKVTVDRVKPAFGSGTINGNANATWFNTRTLNISGNFTDPYTGSVTGSGVNEIKYRVDTATSTGTVQTLPTTNGSYNTNVNLDDYISTTATTATIKIWAKDAAGNEMDASSYQTYTVNVDTSGPEISSLYYSKADGSLEEASGTVYVQNGTQIILYGNYKDEQSGVKDITSVKIGNTTITPVVTYSTSELSSTASATGASWAGYSTYSDKTTIRSWKAVFTTGTTGGTLTLEGENNAGTKTPLTALSIMVDSTPPDVTISTPVANAKVGATALTISGTASDGTGAGLSNDNMILYYTKFSSLGTATTAPASTAFGSDAATKWVQLDNTITAGTTWTVTKTLEDSVTPDDANTDIYFMASAKDNAGSGNTGYSAPRKVTVDRVLPVYDSSETSIGGKTHAQMTASPTPWHTASTLTVSGKFTDTNGSGVDKIIVQRDTATPVEVSTTDGTFTTNISGFTSNSTLTIKAVDKVGLESSVQSYTVKADTSAPSLTASHYKKGSGNLTAAGGTVYVQNGTQITLYGNYKDEQSGIQSLKLFKNYDEATKTEIDSGVTFTYSTTAISGTTIPDDYAAYNSTSATSYRSWRAVFNASSTISGSLTVEGKNIAELTSSVSACNITIDGEDPTLENIKLKETTGTGDTAVTKESYISGSDYYINNTSASGKTYKITGVVSDNYGVETLSIAVTNTGNASKTLSIPSISNASGAFEFTLSGMSTWTSGASAVITATDKSGRIKTQTVNIVFDTIAPRAMHWADSKHKDVYFRVGNANNDRLSSDNTKNEANQTWDSSLDESVGSKYAFGSWGNASTIELRGTFEETGSGLKAVHYKIFSEIPGASDISSLGSSTNPYDGDIAVVSGEERRVIYNVNTGTADANGNPIYTKSSMNVTSNFRGQIPGFNDSNNYLVLVAEDYVGNLAADTLAVYGGPSATPETGNSNWNSINHNTATAYFSLNKDTTVPTITSTTSTQATNGTQSITVTGNVSDAESGVKSVTVSIDEVINSHAITYSAEAGKTNGTDWTGGWTLTIPANTFNVTGVNAGNVTVYATAKDNAGTGNEKTISAANVIIDKMGPELTIDTTRIKDADDTTSGTQVNGSIELKGTAYDTNGIRTEASGATTLKLYYTEDSTLGTASTNTTAPAESAFGPTPTSQWVELSSAAHAANWTFSDVDTTTIASGLTAKTAYLMVGGYDAAGNVGYSAPVTVIVDQKTDRPVVKFNNLARNGTSYILKYGTSSQLEGTVSDDDATNSIVVTDFIISSEPITAIPESGSGWTRNPANNNGSDEISWSHTSYGTTSYNKISGGYTYTPPVTADGAKDIYFLIKDNAGHIYYTANTAELNRPYQQYKQETKTLNSAVLNYNSDSTSPTISNVKLQAYTGETANGGEVEPGTSTVVGGSKKNKVKFIIKANDANGIASMSLEYTPAGGTKTTISTASNGTFAETTNNSDATWTTDYIDVSNFTTGSVSVAITANDQSGLFANRNPVFMVDNTGPAINISSPSESDEVTGAVSIAGQATDEGGAGSPTINFLIPTTTQSNAAGTTLAAQLAYYKTITTIGEGGWIGRIHGDKTPSSFEYVFNGDVNDNSSLDIYTNSDNSNSYPYTADVDGIYTVPVFFRSEDALGNVNVVKFNTKYNPDADKPRTEISYPSSANYLSGNNYVTLGGRIRVTGSVTIPSLSTTPEEVYIQISDDTGNFDTADKTKAGTGTGNYGYTVLSISDVESSSGINKPVTGLTTTARSAWWGIKAVRSSNAWSFNLNDTGSLNVTTEDKINRIKIRACAVNAEGKMGVWSDPVSIHIDASAPEYTTKLYQFSSTPTAASHTPSGEKDYEAGVYLKGEWYLGIHMVDEDTIVIENVERENVEVAAADILKVFSNNNKTLDMYIKLTSAASQTYKITARDNAEGNYHYVYPTYEIKVDNTAPSLSDIKTGEGYKIDMTKQRTSNKTMTFTATATDEGSGFSRLAYYFKHGTGDSQTIELPVPLAENATAKQWKLGTKYSGALTVTQDDLYGVSLTGTKAFSGTNGENTTFTSDTALTSYTFIRKGAIVKMAGTYHLITDVSGNAITISGRIETAVTSAFFPAAFIVDNTSSENPTWNGAINTITGDDGDGITESVRKTGSTWTWDTSIYAGELDDGELTLVTVAFDVAENSAKKEATFMLANKTPRLSKLYLATDLNGNGKYSDDELGTSVITESEGSTVQKYYSALNSGLVQDIFTVYGKQTDTANSTTDSGITMRDKIGMAFEFISGNENYGSGQGDLKYKLSVSQAAITDAEEKGSTETLASLGTASASNYDNTASSVTAGLIGKKFLELTPAMFTGSTTYGTYREYLTSGETGYNNTAGYYRNYLHVTLWDSTNDKAGIKDGAKTSHSYTDSNDNSATYDTYASFGAQWTAFNVPLYMDLVDGVRPNVTIENPVVVTHTVGTGTAAKEVSDGHIDLRSTLGDSFTATGSNEMDRDDKVSGKFKFTGTINDDKRVDNIKLTVSKQFSSTAISSDTLVEYNATYGVFNRTTYSPATGITFNILSSSFSLATGHTVEWELVVDSSLVANVASANVLFTLTANDGTTNNNGTATHQVDIVPYITEITRADAISGGNMNRSKNGRYPVSEGETITVKGYNLGASGQWTVGTHNTTTTYNGATKDTTTGIYSFSMTVPARSGELSVTTSSIKSLNNLNSTSQNNNKETFTMKGSSVKYTAQDDRYLAVWNLGNYFKYTNGGAELQKPVMTADKNGNLYASWAAQSNSNIMFSYGVKENCRPIFRFYDQPSVYTSVTFDTKAATSGGALVGFIPEHQGTGGTFAVNAMSSATVVGGMGAIQIPSNVITAKTMNTDAQNVRVEGNPKMHGDGTENVATNNRGYKNYSSWYNLANYGMNRRLGSFESPNSARYGNYLHTIWFDNVTEGLKYSVVSTDDATKFDLNPGAIAGWVVIDGGYTGQDRVHSFDTTSDNNRKNNTLFVNGSNAHTTQGTGTYNARYSDDIFYDSVTSSTTTSVTVGNGSYRDKFAVGDTIALLGNTSGAYQIALRTISEVTGNTISWTEAYSGDIDSVTIYGGNMNVLGGTNTANYSSFSAAANQSSSAGKSSSIDVDTNGRPVIAYQSSSDSTLRVARFNTAVAVSAANMGLAANWTRTVVANVSCSGEVSAKVDSGNNLHIMYKNDDGQLCYLFGTPSGNTYNFNAPEIIDETGSMDYGTLSVIETATSRIPCVTYLNSAGTAQAVKYAVRSSAPAYDEDSTASDTLSEDWDFMILPSLGSGHYAVKENQVSLEARKTDWTGNGDTLQNGGGQATATPATVQAAIAFKSTQFETAYLKTE
jgi:hypothetical protein